MKTWLWKSYNVLRKFCWTQKKHILKFHQKFRIKKKLKNCVENEKVSHAESSHSKLTNYFII